MTYRELFEQVEAAGAMDDHVIVEVEGRYYATRCTKRMEEDYKPDGMTEGDFYIRADF